MSNINNMTSKIIKDAEEKSKEILASAEEEKNKILLKKINIANELKTEIVMKSEIEAKSKKERMISGATLKARNSKLGAKQNVIQSVFTSSIERLNNLSKEEFIEFVKNTILSLGEIGDQNLILNKDGIELVDINFVNSINESLGNNGNITVSNKIGVFKGGFILEKDGVEMNNTYDALVSSLVDELEFEVASILFN
ncbi:MAG: V-type ATP synthase subunit E family protein [Clostridium sp.]